MTFPAGNGSVPNFPFFPLFEKTEQFGRGKPVLARAQVKMNIELGSVRDICRTILPLLYREWKQRSRRASNKKPRRKGIV